jgi:hypothetical protein
MDKPLSIYLNDHLAGAELAIELLERLAATHPSNSLGKLATTVLIDVVADRDVLQELCDKADAPGNELKLAGAWLAERVSRLKLRLGNGLGLGEFESLEMLSLGILGKQKMWKALHAIASLEKKLRQLDYPTLIRRAEQQHNAVEQYRLIAARETFSTQTPTPD